jgi:hypothetical protein
MTVTIFYLYTPPGPLHCYGIGIFLEEVNVAEDGIECRMMVEECLHSSKQMCDILVILRMGRFQSGL